MNWFDLAVALLVIGCVAGEIRQGFGKSGFGLLAAVAAYLMAAWLAPVNAVVFLVVFVLLACGLGVVAWLLGRFFRDVGPEWFDRLLGGAFGLANALLLAVLALAAWMSFAPRFEREWVLWSVEPELAYGILPRTQLEIGLPVFVAEGAGNGRTHGVGAVHVSVLHALNVESLGWPALALNLAAAIPAGEFGPDAAYGAVGGIATRTTRLARVHVNVDAVIGPSTAGSGTGGAHDLERWSAGVALDRAMPLRSLLVAAEVVAGRPMDPADDLRWRAGAGIRWQLTPYWAVDAGIGRAFGDEREWSLTFGAARAFGLVRLPRARR